MAHQTLQEAKESKADEFYTQIEDIEKELKHYKQYFKDKVILCNCDDPYESNFFKYFALNFNNFGIKKLICTCYDGSSVAGEQLSIFDIDGLEPEKERQAYKVELTSITDYNHDGQIDLSDVEQILKRKKSSITLLKGNGDFRSEECINILKEADIICTNPPFSLFRSYISQLEEYKKKYIIIGNINALGYRETFKLFKEDKIRTGYTNFNVGMYFFVPENTEKYHKIVNGKKMVRVSTSCWFTNLPVKKHMEDLILTKEYKGHEEDYPKYYNYDAINVNSYNNIPCDYNGDMGVPLTFLDKFNPSQFELIGLGISNSGIECGVQPYTPEHKKYRKEVQKKGAVDGDLYMLDEEGHPLVPYSRILLRRKR